MRNNQVKFGDMLPETMQQKQRILEYGCEFPPKMVAHIQS